MIPIAERTLFLVAQAISSCGRSTKNKGGQLRFFERSPACQALQQQQKHPWITTTIVTVVLSSQPALVRAPAGFLLLPAERSEY
jgi:hypothetical protein